MCWLLRCERRISRKGNVNTPKSPKMTRYQPATNIHAAAIAGAPKKIQRVTPTAALPFPSLLTNAPMRRALPTKERGAAYDLLLITGVCGKGGGTGEYATGRTGCGTTDA